MSVSVTSPGQTTVQGKMDLSVRNLTTGPQHAKQSPTPARAKLGLPNFKRLFSSGNSPNLRKTSTCSIESVNGGKEKKQLKCASMHNLHNTQDKDTTVSIKSYLLKSPRWGRSSGQITVTKPQKGVVIDVTTKAKRNTTVCKQQQVSQRSPKLDKKTTDTVRSQVKFELGTPEGQRRCNIGEECGSQLGGCSGLVVTIPLPLVAYRPSEGCGKGSEQGGSDLSVHKTSMASSLRLGTSSPDILTYVHDNQRSRKLTKTSTMDCMVSSPLAGTPDMGMSRSIHSYNEALSNASFQSFFTRKVKSNLKRTKSVNKLDRRKVSTAGGVGSGNNGEVDGSPRFSLKRTMSLGRLTKKSLLTKSQTNYEGHKNSTPGKHQVPGSVTQMRTSHSHESLLTSPSSLHSVDLTAGDIEIKPLHSSMLGQEHCFQVTSSSGSKYYSCSSAEERDKWIKHLQKTVQPNPEQSHRTENSLKLWIQEAKNVSSKKRYFCELCLDRIVYARTSTKTKNELLFWGEMFEFNNLPPVELITVNVYREPDKKKKKDKNTLIGYVNITSDEVSTRQYVERWYTASSATVGRSGKDSRGDNPIVRVKARYLSTDILPVHMYTKLTQYVEGQYSLLVDELEPVISVKAKEEIATALVHLLQKRGKVKDFLSDIVMTEVTKLENENLAFRGNSIATKAMEAYLKLVGEKYLQDTLGDFIKTLLESGDDCEVDPMKLSSSTALQRHKEILNMYCEMAWFKIINSHCFFPRELKQVFHSLKERCSQNNQTDLAEHLISASIFLRFLCPSILSPSLFQLTQELPHDSGARSLTLVAKTIQTLANFTRFGAKEDYMTFLNEFVEREQPAMKNFIQHISEVGEGEHVQEFDGFIDTGKELSRLHTLLEESLPKLSEASVDKLSGLSEMLEELTEALKNPELAVLPTEGGPSELSVLPAESTASEGQVSEDSPTVATSETSESSVFLTSKESRQEGQTEYSAFLPVYGGSAFDNPHRNGTLPKPTDSTGDSHMYRSTLNTSVTSCLATSTPIPTEDRLRPSPNVTSPKLSEQQISYSWNKMLSAANAVSGDYVDLISFVDDTATTEEEPHNSSTELTELGDHTSVEQVSTVGSSGYQSYTGGGYSQSSSPIDSMGQSASQEANKSAYTSTVHTVIHAHQKPLSFANPMFGQLPSRFVYSQDPRRRGMQKSPSTSSVSSSEDSSQLSLKSISSQSRHQPMSKEVVYANGALINSESGKVRTAQPPTDLLLQPYNTQVSSVYSPQHTDHSPLLTTELSLSAEFSHLRRQQATIGQHSPGTVDSGMTSLGQQSPGTLDTGMVSPRKAGTPQSAVRMGISSVQRRIHEQDLKKSEYEQELGVLRLQLQETQQMLEETQSRLLSEESHRKSIMSSWQQQLTQSEQRLQQQQQAKDRQMEEICTRLLTVEEDLRHEQTELQTVLSDKEQIIHQQEEKIHGLDAANNRLLCALGSLRERYIPHPFNGISPTISLKEGEGLRSSSC